MVTVRRVRRAPSFGVLATVVASLAFAAACLLPAPRVARADSKTSSLTSIVTLQADDLVQVVDVHDTTTAPTGPAGSSKKMTIAQLFGSPSTGQLVGWGTVATPITLGSGLSLSGGTLTATGGSGSGTVNAGTSGQLTYYAAGGTAVSGLTVGSGLSISGGTITATGGSGSGTVNAGTSGQLAYYAADGTAVSGLGVGAGLSIVGGSLTATGGGGGSGTVTSVGLTVPSWLSVTGSPVTSSGTLAVSAASAQAQNKVLASPNGSSGAVALRSIVAADLPAMVASGASHAAGIVPDPGVTAGTTRFLREDATWAVPAGGGGSGTVTAVSVASANGLAGTVANATTTPAITLSTSVTGLVKGNGTALSAATAGTDYLAPSGSGAALTGITAGQVSGLAASATTDTTNATNIASGTLAAGRLPTAGLQIDQSFSALAAPGDDGTTLTLALGSNNLFSATLAGNRAVSVSGGNVGQTFGLRLQQAASGGPYSVTSWLSGATVTWFGSPYAAPSMPATASAWLSVTFRKTGATAYDAWWNGNSAN